jgi:hypothetical protein
MFLWRNKMQTGETMTREQISKRLLQADIRGAHSETLLFITLFGTADLKQLAKAELSKRNRFDENESSHHLAFSIVANC